MSRKITNQPEYGTELKLAAVRRVLAGKRKCRSARTRHSTEAAVCVEGSVCRVG
jgi:hypothetical protein